MKKIILIFLITFLLSSCGTSEKSKNIQSNKTELKKEVINNTSNLGKLEELVNQQKFDEAIPQLKKLYEEDKNTTNALNYTSAILAKGSITRQEKKYGEEAEVILKEAIEKDPNNSELYRNLGYSYEIREKYDEAFKAYDQSIEKNPQNALAYANRGHAYRLYGDYYKAEKDFQKAYELNPKDDFILINLAWVYLGNLAYDEAIKYYNEAIKNSKDIRFRAEAYHSIGLIYLGQNKIDEAEIAFKNTIEEDEKFELGYLGLSDIYMTRLVLNKELTDEERKELLNKALKNVEIAIALNPTKAISYMKKGIILNEIDPKEARLLYQLALDATDVDLTLGKEEKKDLKDYIIYLIKENENKK